jgi:hypothetical protein
MIFGQNTEKRIKNIFQDKTGKLDEYTRLENKLAVDEYLLRHSNAVCDLSRSICIELKLDDERTMSIVAAAKLHDIGLADFYSMKSKIGQQEKLKEEVCRNHHKNGAVLVRGLNNEFHGIENMILNHHERYDGTGPRCISGFDIDLGSSIISVADYFDKQLYDEKGRIASMSLERALNNISTYSGKMFNPSIVSAFMKISAVSAESTLSGLRTGNFNFKLRLGNYLEEAKDYFRINPECSQSEMEKHLKGKIKMSDNNSRFISAYYLSRKGKQVEFPSWPTLAKDNIIKMIRMKNKLDLDFMSYSKDIQPGDFVICEKNVWNVLLMSKNYVSLGK